MTPPGPPPATGDALAAQLAAREHASRADAAVQGRRRSEAAARALGATPPRRHDEHPEAQAPWEAAIATDDRPAPPPPPSIDVTDGPTRPLVPGPWPLTTTAGDDDRPLPPSVLVPRGGPGALATGALAAAAQRSHPEEPVMELRPTVVATDIDRVGDQLVVLRDRLELRDRHGTVRRSLDLDDIELVQVHRKPTSAVLEITTRVATDLVIKGLRPESADAAKEAIEELCPATSTSSPEADERALVRALLDLHRAGVIDDAELAAKKALVAQAVRRVEQR